ncbi:hypothetical protein DPMN_142264 [Dreissena polymorpha]|uniref:Uncharacterized protein n=1 Tax=Dreissena polymorpha TaxID=45954 RepID=A0A9D4GAT5_DREPO|nr:hypothetical protein DPMN_142264 [Dreissena polymorpha]
MLPFQIKLKGLCLRLCSIGSQSPELLSNATFVDANGALKLTCTQSKSNVVIWWRKPVDGSQFDNVLAASTGSTCLFDHTPLPDMFAGCDCAGSTFTCTLISVSRNNDGDKWKCSAVTSPQSFSQELTIAVAGK